MFSCTNHSLTCVPANPALCLFHKQTVLTVVTSFSLFGFFGWNFKLLERFRKRKILVFSSLEVVAGYWAYFKLEVHTTHLLLRKQTEIISFRVFESLKWPPYYQRKDQTLFTLNVVSDVVWADLAFLVLLSYSFRLRNILSVKRIRKMHIYNFLVHSDLDTNTFYMSKPASSMRTILKLHSLQLERLIQSKTVSFCSKSNNRKFSKRVFLPWFKTALGHMRKGNMPLYNMHNVNRLS